ncbi:MAG: hypothetical protein SGI72_08590 [Planctomycetota bacterium]|mgnify:CR=1 FL=1|nr:hypothetical protein [Planctomycetota bacterium]
MKSIAIVVMCILAAIAYGIVHDSITARICVEYFTIGHSRVIASTDPTPLAVTWAVLATWWIGALLGSIWAFSARFGTRPKFGAKRLVRPLFLVILVTAAGACFGGGVGHELAVNHIVVLQGELARVVPEERHVAFLTCLWAHSASYLAAAISGLVVAVWTWRARGRSA